MCELEGLGTRAFCCVMNRERIRRLVGGERARREDLAASLLIFQTGNHMVFSSWKSGEDFRAGPARWLAASDSFGKAEIQAQVSVDSQLPGRGRAGCESLLGA